MPTCDAPLNHAYVGDAPWLVCEAIEKFTAVPLQVDTVGLGLMLIVGVTGLVMLNVVAVLVAVALVTQLALLVNTQVIEPPVVPASL